MDANNLAQRLSKFQKSVDNIYSNASQLDVSPNSHLRAAYKELGTASEELQVAIEEITNQVEELTFLRSQLQAEQERYQNLFESLPVAYLITDADGRIRQFNQAATGLFNIKPKYLLGKPMAVFLIAQERQSFYTKLNQLDQQKTKQQWTLAIQPRDRAPLVMSVKVVPVYRHGKLICLQWCLQDFIDNKLIHQPDFELNQYPQRYYSQGEIISLHPASLFLVKRGLVKLTTVSEDGAEVLVGIAGQNMPFGSSMTSLPTYQATALSETVKLISISLKSIAHSQIRDTLFPQILSRLRQTEALLAIAGKRRIQDRLHYLLLWLKQNYGQLTEQGICLSIRLTHQELADACCTTRVSIARELSKLKKAGKITYDSDYRIVFVGDRL